MILDLFLLDSSFPNKPWEVCYLLLWLGYDFHDDVGLYGYLKHVSRQPSRRVTTLWYM